MIAEQLIQLTITVKNNSLKENGFKGNRIRNMIVWGKPFHEVSIFINNLNSEGSAPVVKTWVAEKIFAGFVLIRLCLMRI